MRTETPPIVRLEDYRPSDFLIDRVELDVRLHPTGDPRHGDACAAAQSGRPQRCAARARRRRARSSRPIALDGRALPAGAFEATPQSLTIAAAAAAAVHADDRDRDRPDRQHQADGALSLERQLLHAMRGRGLPPHHLFPRPARRARRSTRRASRPSGTRRRCCSATATSSRAGAIPGTDRHFAVWHDPHPKPSYLFALVGGGSASVGQDLHDRERPPGRARHLCRAGQGGPRRLRARCARALDALGRGRLRPRIRSRRVQHRRRVRLQHGRDGEQGPQHLQRQIRAGLPGDRDRRRLRRISRRSSRTSISTTGPATASPAATGSSSA